MVVIYHRLRQRFQQLTFLFHLARDYLAASTTNVWIPFACSTRECMPARRDHWRRVVAANLGAGPPFLHANLTSLVTSYHVASAATRQLEKNRNTSRVLKKNNRMTCTLVRCRPGRLEDHKK